MWTETRQTAFTAVHLSGGQEAIGSAKGRLEAAGFRLSPTGGHSILLENILSGDLADIEAMAAEHGLTLEALGEKEITIRSAAPKPFKLNLEAGKWYWADNLEDTTPLIYVKDVEATTDAQLLTLEYLAPEGLPVPVRVDSREVVEYGFRPATVEDFERYDLVAPDYTSLVPVTAEVKEVAPAKPKSANRENFKKRQTEVMERKKASAELDELQDEIAEQREYIDDLTVLQQEEGISDRRWERLEEELEGAEDELAELEEKRHQLVERPLY